MKKILCRLVTVIGVLVLVSSCSFFNNLFSRYGEAEGVKLIISTDDFSSKTTGMRGITPQSARIAFSKIWYPTQETFAALKLRETAHEMGYIHIDPDTDWAALEYYKPLTATPDTPVVFDVVNRVTYAPEVLPSYGETFNGVLLDIVYYEFTMEDFSIRWYVRDSGTYKKQDVLVDFPNDQAGWKFVYNKRVIEFDFLNVSLEGSMKVDNVRVIPDQTKLITSLERIPDSGWYFENWYNADEHFGNDYVWEALAVYGLRDAYLSDGTDLQNETLTKYLRIVNDADFVVTPVLTYLGQEVLEGKWADSGSLSTNPLLMAGFNPDSYENPNAPFTEPEETNSAQTYLFEISFSQMNCNQETIQQEQNGLLISPSIFATANWAALSAQTGDLIVIGLNTGGIETRFGWIDFNGEYQGEFTEESGY